MAAEQRRTVIALWIVIKNLGGKLVRVLATGTTELLEYRGIESVGVVLDDIAADAFGQLELAILYAELCAVETMYHAFPDPFA